MKVSTIPAGVMLMHVRSFTGDYRDLNDLKYPTWYFKTPTELLFVPTKTPAVGNGDFFAPNKDESAETLNNRKFKILKVLSEQNKIEKTDPLFTRLLEPLARCQRDNLKIDIFKVTQDLPLLFLPTQDSPGKQVGILNAFVHTQDETWQPKLIGSLEALQWLFDNKKPGIIFEKLNPTRPINYDSFNEVYLNQQAVPYLAFVGTITVRRYLEYVASLT